MVFMVFIKRLIALDITRATSTTMLIGYRTLYNRPRFTSGGFRLRPTGLPTENCGEEVIYLSQL